MYVLYVCTVCVYVCTVCIYVCTVWRYVCLYVCMYVCMYVYNVTTRHQYRPLPQRITFASRSLNSRSVSVRIGDGALLEVQDGLQKHRQGLGVVVSSGRLLLPEHLRDLFQPRHEAIHFPRITLCRVLHFERRLVRPRLGFKLIALLPLLQLLPRPNVLLLCHY